MSDLPSAHRLAVAGEPGALADTLTLTHEARHLRRSVMQGDGGLSLLIDLPHATVLAEGDRLMLDDGRLVAVRAAPEPLLEVRAADAHHLVRLAWHLGNRHLPTQIEADRLLIARDHVIADMLTRQGAHLAEIEAPFMPGAYGHGATHGYSH